MENEPNNRPDGIEPPAHNDGPTGRPENITGAGREATIGDYEAKEHERAHWNDYISSSPDDSYGEVQ